MAFLEFFFNVACFGHEVRDLFVDKVRKYHGILVMACRCSQNSTPLGQDFMYLMPRFSCGYSQCFVLTQNLKMDVTQWIGLKHLVLCFRVQAEYHTVVYVWKSYSSVRVGQEEAGDFFGVSYSGNARMGDTGVPMFEGAVCEVMINSYWCVCRHLLVGRRPTAVMHMSLCGLGSKSCSGGNNCHSYVLLRHCVINSSFKMNQNHYWVIMPMYMISFPQLYTQR